MLPHHPSIYPCSSTRSQHSLLDDRTDENSTTITDRPNLLPSLRDIHAQVIVRHPRLRQIEPVAAVLEREVAGAGTVGKLLLLAQEGGLPAADLQVGDALGVPDAGGRAQLGTRGVSLGRARGVGADLAAAEEQLGRGDALVEELLEGVGVVEPEVLLALQAVGDVLFAVVPPVRTHAPGVVAPLAAEVVTVVRGGGVGGEVVGAGVDGAGDDDVVVLERLADDVRLQRLGDILLQRVEVDDLGGEEAVAAEGHEEREIAHHLQDGGLQVRLQLAHDQRQPALDLVGLHLRLAQIARRQQIPRQRRRLLHPAQQILPRHLDPRHHAGALAQPGDDPAPAARTDQPQRKRHHGQHLQQRERFGERQIQHPTDGADVLARQDVGPFDGHPVREEPVLQVPDVEGDVVDLRAVHLLPRYEVPRVWRETLGSPREGTAVRPAAEFEVEETVGKGHRCGVAGRLVVGYPVGDPPSDVEHGPALLELVRRYVCALGDLVGCGVRGDVSAVFVGVDSIGWDDRRPVRSLGCGGEIGDGVAGLGGANGGDVAFRNGSSVAAAGR